MSSGIKRIFLFSLILCAAFSALPGDSRADFSFSSVPTFKSISDDGEICDDVNISSRFYELIFGNKNKNSERTLIVGGDTFGIKIKEDYITVSEAAQGSPLKMGDKIISINGTAIEDTDDISEILSGCGGRAINIEILRSGERLTLTVIPKLDGDTYKLGIKLKRYTSGIGTVTYIDPETHVFGGLGHGVYDSDSVGIVNISSGEACDVILGGVKRGEVGKPGELSGILTRRVTGSIYKNTECGVFGTFDKIPDNPLILEVGERSDVKTGEAEIITTVKSGKKARYKIEITEINTSSTGSKSFKIKVVDDALIAISGGIVRGMSGSPIIQNGKLIGAVTHVMVADPTEGYGIFIENMLNAAQSQVQPKAA